ncbi:MAG: 30S ribosomal protein S9 [Candidatus Bathyarchaeota archaeon]
MTQVLFTLCATQNICILLKKYTNGGSSTTTSTPQSRSLKLYHKCPVCKKKIKGIRFKRHVLNHWISSRNYEEFPDFIRRVYDSKVKIPFKLSKRKPQFLPTIGKKKTAVAKAVIASGNGCVRINRVPIEIWQPKIAREKIVESLILVETVAKKIDVDVRAQGGGFMGQAMAVRTAIARAIVGWERKPSIKKRYMNYDRTLLVSNPRRKESKKFHRKGARARRQKSYR